MLIFDGSNSRKQIIDLKIRNIQIWALKMICINWQLFN